jgi:hypothetical protein
VPYVEVRSVFNLHAFNALARGHLRCFVVPCPDDAAARVIVTTGSRALAPGGAVLYELNAVYP